MSVSLPAGQVDKGGPVQSAAKRDIVDRSRADNAFDVGDGDGIGCVGEIEAVIAGAEVDRRFEGRAASVIVSAPEPPMTVSTFVTVARFAKSPNVSLSAPLSRSIEAFDASVPSVISSAPVLPRTVSTLETEPTLANAPSNSVSAPAPRSICCVERSALPSVTLSAPVAPVSVSTLATVACWQSCRE